MTYRFDDDVIIDTTPRIDKRAYYMDCCQEQQFNLTTREYTRTEKESFYWLTWTCIECRGTHKTKERVGY